MLGPEGVRLREVRLYSDHLDKKKTHEKLFLLIEKFLLIKHFPSAM